jgi:hypothetical protein
MVAPPICTPRSGFTDTICRAITGMSNNCAPVVMSTTRTRESDSTTYTSGAGPSFTGAITGAGAATGVCSQVTCGGGTVEGSVVGFFPPQPISAAARGVLMHMLPHILRTRTRVDE